MVLMTNEKGIKEKDIVSFQCTLARDGDNVYYNMLRAHLDRPEVARAFFQYLKARDYDSLARLEKNDCKSSPCTTSPDYNCSLVFPRFLHLK
jgi:hypothetical protein